MKRTVGAFLAVLLWAGCDATQSPSLADAAAVPRVGAGEDATTPPAPGTDPGTVPSAEQPCPDDWTFFTRDLQPLLTLKCAGCHSATGLAKGSDLVLAPPGADEAEEANFDTLTALAAKTLEGEPVLLLRPSGLHPEGHPGGTLAPPGSADYALLAEWVARVAGEEPCAPPVATCEAPRPGPPALRRLTRAEYDRTVEALFGFESTWGQGFTAEVVAHGFDNQSDALSVTPLLATQLQEAAEGIAAQAVQTAWPSLVACEPSAPGCAQQVIAGLGQRVFRRPMTEADTARYLALFEAAGNFAGGVEWVITAMLQSPHFLYRFELGTAAEDGLHVLTPWEVASELSYLLWGTMPDEELFDRAADGTLTEPDELTAQARRLLADPRAEWAVRRFATQWLNIGLVHQLPKDAATYPELTAAHRADMREEALRYVTGVLLGGQPLSALFDGPERRMTADLAAFYGLPAPADADSQGFGVVDVAGTPYDAGVLTTGAVLLSHAFPSGSSPIHRGKLVRENLLCHELTPPPPGLVAQVPAATPDTTTRERFASHMSVQPCLDCHRLTDPIGFGFEHFDGVGRYRETDGGLPIDDTAEILLTQTLDGVYQGPGELAAALGASPEVAACFTRKWMTFGYGRSPEAELACLADDVTTQFLAGGTTFEALIMALVGSPHFLRRVAPGALPEPAPIERPEPSEAPRGEEPMPQPPGPQFAAEVTVASDWAEGFCHHVTVVNTGPTAGTWQVVLEVPGALVNVWDASHTPGPEPGTTVFAGLSYNAALAAGAAVTFGYCGSKT